jgi:hypothetical protein
MSEATPSSDPPRRNVDQLREARQRFDQRRSTETERRRVATEIREHSQDERGTPSRGADADEALDAPNG